MPHDFLSFPPAPYLHVIKIGGNVIDHDTALEQFLDDIATLNPANHQWILVHGGGKIATHIAQRLGVEATMIEGRRVTDAAMLEIVTMVYGGLVNKRIVARLQARGINALGFTGADANLITAHKRQHPTIDYGFVGDIDTVNAGQIQRLLASGIVPVLAPLTHDGHGTLLNTNADTIASRVASAMSHYYTVQLVYCFEKRGVLEDIHNERSVIPTLSLHDTETLQQRGIINKGMMPKIENARAALSAGVHIVEICHSDCVLPALRLEQPGTRITA